MGRTKAKPLYFHAFPTKIFNKEEGEPKIAKHLYFHDGGKEGGRT